MIYPSIGKLVAKTNSRYSLVIAIAKRARSIAEGEEPLVYCRSSDKAVKIAITEMWEDKIRIKPPISNIVEIPSIREV